MKTSFSPKILEQVERYRNFYASGKSGLMGIILVGSDGGLGNRVSLDLIDWSDRQSCRIYAEKYLQNCRDYWNSQPVLDDDRICSFQNLAGSGIIGAAFVKDATVRLEKETNYLEAPLLDWDKDMDRICFDPENKWFKAQMWMLEYYLENWDATFGLSPFTHFGPLDLCNQWRGNQLFYDFYDYPQELKILLKKAKDCILEAESYIRNSYMKDFPQEGSMFGVWTPGNYLSCDAGDMCGQDILAAYEIPYVSEIAQVWQGAFLHHHELGRRQIQTWEKCKGLSLQFLNRDPNTAHLAQDMPEDIIRSSLKLPVNFIAAYREFMEHADYWAHGRFVVVVCCDDERQAREICGIIRSSRNF